jgi:nucleoside-diphosphate-sugar epimerase
MIKKIAITGANGFIGKALTEALLNHGFEVVAFVRKIPKIKAKNIEYQYFELGKPLIINDFEGIDVLIHLAYQAHNKTILADDINIFSAQQIKNLGIKQTIFVSSFAAVPPVGNSYYAKCKTTIEEIFRDETIIRPALVVGEGGLFLRLKKQIKKNPFVPLMNGGNQIMQMIEVKSLTNKIIEIIEKQKKGLFHIANPEPTTYKQVISLIAKQLDKRVYFIPVPIWVLKFVIKILSFLPNPPITQDNLEGLLASKYVDCSENITMS